MDRRLDPRSLGTWRPPPSLHAAPGAEPSGVRARAPDSARSDVHLTQQSDMPCFSFPTYKEGIRSHSYGIVSMKHLAECLAILSPKKRKAILLGHSSCFFHIPYQKRGTAKVCQDDLWPQAGKTPAKPGPSWNLLGQDLLQTVGLGQWGTPKLLSKGRKLSNGRILGPGTGLPWRP